MVKKQTKAGRLQVAKNKNKVQDALHDTDATGDEVNSPGLNDKEPYPPKDTPGTREMAPDRPDELPIYKNKISKKMMTTTHLCLIGIL
jgi:hypothetical protein